MPVFTRRTLLAAAAALPAAACATRAALPAGAPALERRVLWAANVRTKPLADRLAAARAGGFTHFSIFPVDWQGWRQSGVSAADLRAQIRDAGVKVLAVDPFVQWIPGFAIPDAYPEANRSFIAFSEAQILQIAEESGAEAINCVEGLGEAYPADFLAEALGGFADRAAARGLRLTLEFMPISSITGLREGWGLVSAVNRANLGLCFDTWHYFRSYEDAALLSSIPGNKVFEVQLADARRTLQGDTLVDDLLRFRRLPGDGEFPIAAVTDTLKSIGGWTSAGPEVFADWIDPLAPEEVGRRCGEALGRYA
jgi:sugar phosphate isomerase/epimerase